MSSKLNVLDIVRSHLSTLRDHATGRTSVVDMAVFYGLPICLSLTGALNGWTLKSHVLEALVTVGALLAGLMLNLLIIILDRSQRVADQLRTHPGDKSLSDRADALHELYYNISYVTLLSLGCAAIPVLALQLDETPTAIGMSSLSVRSALTDPLLLFLATHLALTALMVTKRTFRLMRR